ncbi:PLDc N-terminal domain-containing protein [Marinoscillum sp.]|uniref:PLDc N-terminal domain-containing protein n=1 Tax=Marinoscillum sp. TaxID=2024838 RepID=UPI003BAC9837
MTLTGLGLLLWFLAIINLTRTRFDQPHYRTIWLVIILFFPLLGSIIYFQLKKNYAGNPRKFRPQFQR